MESWDIFKPETIAKPSIDSLSKLPPYMAKYLTAYRLRWWIRGPTGGARSFSYATGTGCKLQMQEPSTKCVWITGTECILYDRIMRHVYLHPDATTNGRNNTSKNDLYQEPRRLTDRQ